jgi:hypothetical protein
MRISMAHAAQPILVEGQQVHVDLEQATEAQAAVVLGFAGPALVLLLVGTPDAGFLRAVALRSTGYVHVRHAGRPYALRGEALAGGRDDQVIVQVTDPFRLGQNREYARAPIAAPARLAPAGGGATLDTTTCDLSVGGAALRRPRRYEPAPAWEVELRLDGESPPLSCAAHVQRETADRVMLRFVDVSVEGQRALMRAVVTWYREQALAPPESEPAIAALLL